MNYKELKRRIQKEAQLIKVETTLGTAIKVSKKEACRLVDMLERRQVEPGISFTDIGNGKYLIVFSKHTLWTPDLNRGEEAKYQAQRSD